MATRNDMLESKYIQKTDLTQPTRLTVAGCERKDIGQENKPEFRWVVAFEGEWKPLILNRTNTDAFFDGLGEDSNDWIGKQIILFNDMSVEYQGKRGGIRVYQQMEVADAQAPPSQFTPDNNLAPQQEDTRDFSHGNPDDRIPGDAL
jgi:hypothetical protein